jgi:hypothetical protein
MACGLFAHQKWQSSVVTPCDPTRLVMTGHRGGSIFLISLNATCSDRRYNFKIFLKVSVKNANVHFRLYMTYE